MYSSIWVISRYTIDCFMICVCVYTLIISICCLFACLRIYFLGDILSDTCGSSELCHFPLTNVFGFFFSWQLVKLSVDYYDVKALVLGFLRMSLFGHSP